MIHSDIQIIIKITTETDGGDMGEIFENAAKAGVVGGLTSGITQSLSIDSVTEYANALDYAGQTVGNSVITGAIRGGVTQ